MLNFPEGRDTHHWDGICQLASDSLQGDDSPLLLGLVASTVAVILVQWLIVHWRVVPAPPTQTSPRFGRGPQPS